MHFSEDIIIRQNLSIVIRERGKIVGRRDGHNIFLNLGRMWMPRLVSYEDLPIPPAVTPVTPADDRRIRYMAVGIGGTRQLMLPVANSPPLSTHYPGTNIQTDTDPTATILERPVRLTSPTPSSPALPPAYDAGDVWLGQVQAPPDYPSDTSVTFKRLFTEDEISFGPFLTVPLCEILLLLHAADVNYTHRPHNTGVAYDTYDPISKTTAFALEVSWTLRF